MKKNLLILALFLASIAPAASMARGFYAAVDAGQSSFDNYCQGHPPGVSCSKTSDKTAMDKLIKKVKRAAPGYGTGADAIQQPESEGR